MTSIVSYAFSGRRPPMDNGLIPYSLSPDYSSPAYGTVEQGTPTNAKLWAFSGWIKWGGRNFTDALIGAGDGTNQNYCGVYTRAGGTRRCIRFEARTGGTLDAQLEFGSNLTGVGVSDFSGWTHILFVFDSAQAVQADRTRLYVQGRRIDITTTLFGGVDQNDEFWMNKSGEDLWALYLYYGANYNCRSRIADWRFIDGYAPSPEEFFYRRGNILFPRQYRGSYGNNGVWLDFSDNGSAGDNLFLDRSGNGNDMTRSGIVSGSERRSTDAPSNNGCLFDANGSVNYGTGYLFRDDDVRLTMANPPGGNNGGLLIPRSGKWYFEANPSGTYGPYAHIGIGELPHDGGAEHTDMYYMQNGNHYRDGADQGAYGDAITSQILGVYVDFDTDTLRFYVNSASQGDISIAGRYTEKHNIMAVCQGVVGSEYADVKFGYLAESLIYAPPAGSQLLKVENLESPIRYPKKGVDVVLYRGDGNATQNIDELDFKPDLIYIRPRTVADNGTWWDSVRGAYNYFTVNAYSANLVETDDGVSAFRDKGFQVAYNDKNITNADGEDYLAFCLKKGPEYGLDIVEYTGNNSVRTVAHNLGKIPELIMVKNKEAAAGHWMYHKNGGGRPYDQAANRYYGFQLGAMELISSTIWNNTEPTSSVFSLGIDANSNALDNDFIAYLFTSIPGFCKVFFYSGDTDDNVNGPLINCGFRPRFIIVAHRTNTAENWMCFDSLREDVNTLQKKLTMDQTTIESSIPEEDYIDILSNGFVIRQGNDNDLRNGDHIGIAWAEAPFKYSHKW